MPAVLWVLAVGSYWTFAHRMYHTWRELTKAEALQIANHQLPVDRAKEDDDTELRNETAQSAIGSRQLEIN
jgi:hypothetical protein